MKFITLGSITVQYLYPVSLSFACFLQYLFYYHYSIKNKKDKAKRFSNIIIDTITLLICGFFGVVYKKCSNIQIPIKVICKGKIILHFVGLMIITVLAKIFPFFNTSYQQYTLDFLKIVQVGIS